MSRHTQSLSSNHLRIAACLAAVYTCLVLLTSPAAYAQDPPWRLNSLLGSPAWLSLSGQHRVRFENLDDQFRLGRRGGDQILAVRTNVLARASVGEISLGAEMLDARAALADRGTPLSTSEVNPLDLLQAYLELPVHDLITHGSTSVIRIGRMTMDVGSRRLVARNSYRNTINAYTGIDWQWTGTDRRQFRLFYTLPVQRRAGPDLLDAQAQLDEESDRIRFWGAWYSPGKLPWGDAGEVFVFGLDEDDTPDFATRNRDLYTFGIRLYRAPAAGGFDYQLESVYQLGTSRSSAALGNVTDLDHFAYFQHVEFGYSIARPWKPRLIAQYDYASGDDDPNDRDNGQFDTLFGARRFDFGPTGIYGPFARANLSSPGLRLTFAPAATLKSMVAARGFWLAARRDAWTTAGVRDASGRSGRYIGTQIEAQLQWAAIPGNLDIESGIAHIFDGAVMDSPPGNGNGAPTYLYLQATLSF